MEKGGADLLHLDVMDGHFVRNLTFGPMIVGAIRKLTSLKLVSHLMIESPDLMIPDFVSAGSDLVTIHAEASGDIARDLGIIASLGARRGLAINPDTPLEIVEDHLAGIDLLLIMSVFPGRGGQKFIGSVLPKVEEARRLREERSLAYAIEIDGGINPQTAPLARRSGADILVAGTAVFRSGDYGGMIADLRGESD